MTTSAPAWDPTATSTPKWASELQDLATDFYESQVEDSDLRELIEGTFRLVEALRNETYRADQAEARAAQAAATLDEHRCGDETEGVFRRAQAAEASVENVRGYMALYRILSAKTHADHRTRSVACYLCIVDELARATGGAG